MADEILKDGEVKPVEVKKTIGWKAGFAAGILMAGTTLVGVEKGIIEPQLEARAAFVVDSIAKEESVVEHKSDSINRANLPTDVAYRAVRPEKSGSKKSDKFNPLYYHEPDEFAIVRTYRGRKGSTDTVFLAEQFIEAKSRWLLVVRGEAVMDNPNTSTEE